MTRCEVIPITDGDRKLWACLRCRRVTPYGTRSPPAWSCEKPDSAPCTIEQFQHLIDGTRLRPAPQEAERCRNFGRLHSSVPAGWLHCGCGSVRLHECLLYGDLTAERPVSEAGRVTLQSLEPRYRRNCTDCPYRPVPLSSITQQDGPAFDISQVTLCSIDCVDPGLAAQHLDQSRRRLEFGRVLLLSHVRQDLPEGVEWLEIPALDLDGYNRFVLRELWRHLDTSHVLVLETDARILRPEVWDDAWLAYDYVGAPWLATAPFAVKSRVGNSGLCLRSAALLRAAAELATDARLEANRLRWGRVLNDVFLCHDVLDELVQRGFRWAPVDVAERFAREDQISLQCFGCHSKKLTPASALRRGPRVVAYVNPNVDRPLPETGLISPAQQKVIQLEITDACPLKCSNCTRLVAHEPAPWFIDRETFARAVDSLRGYSGLVGIMGGEPTIHPQFAELTAHAHTVLQRGADRDLGLAPVVDFAAYRERHLNSLHHRLGLWTSLGRGYRRHYELIQRVFGYQCINTHENSGLHQGLLMARKDLGIADPEWLERRDRCWIQRYWSASINDQGAYFCEIAAAIDRLLFAGRHAWQVEPGWWQRTPADFGAQLELCEYCAAPLSGPRRPDSDGRQDVTQTTADLLRAVGSPARDKLVIHGPECLQPEYRLSAENYLETQGGTRVQRITTGHRSLYADRLDGLVVCVGYGQTLRTSAAHNRPLFDRLVIVTVPEDLETQQVARDVDAELVISNRRHQNLASFNKAALLNDGLDYLRPRDWLLLHDADILLPPSLRTWAFSRVLNPGVLHWTSRYHARSPAETAAVVEDWGQVYRLTRDYVGGDCQAWGFFHLAHPRALALRERGLRMLECFPTAGSVDHEFMLRWPRSHRQRIDSEQDRTLSVVHVWHGNPASGWHAGKEHDRDYWTLVSLLAGEEFWLRREVTYPAWIRVVRVTDGREVLRYCATAADGPLLSAAQFGFAERGQIAWGITTVHGRRRYFWDGQESSFSQYDIYQIGVDPHEPR